MKVKQSKKELSGTYKRSGFHIGATWIFWRKSFFAGRLTGAAGQMQREFAESNIASFDENESMVRLAQASSSLRQTSAPSNAEELLGDEPYVKIEPVLSFKIPKVRFGMEAGLRFSSSSSISDFGLLIGAAWFW